MFIPKRIFYCICLALVTIHCQQKNQLAQNEQAIISELTKLGEIIETEEKINSPGKYLNLPEKSRAADQHNPPIVLDIISARSDIRNISLADLYGKVRYIPIEITPPKDSLFALYGLNDFDFAITPNNIFVSHFSRGIYQYDSLGEFITTVVENDLHYTAIPNRNSFMISREDRQKFTGSSGNMHTLGDKLYFQYHNNPAQKSSMFMYDATPGILHPMTLDVGENQTSAPKGISLFPLPNIDKGIMTSQMGSTNTFPLKENEWMSSMGVVNSSKSGAFLVSTNIQGDTLTRFKDYDPIKNYSGMQLRSVDGEGTQYYFGGVQHIRQPHNDTIYSITNTDQLQPKYVLDFGDRGIESTQEGISVKIDLKEKFIISEFIETMNYLFVIYTQNAPSPNSAKKGELFYNACIYDKIKKELFHIYLDKKPFIPPGKRWPRVPISFLKNNIDNGPAFWPEKVTNSGMPFKPLKISDLQYQSNLWQGHDAMPGILSQMKKSDYLLMIVQ